MLSVLLTASSNNCSDFVSNHLQPWLQVAHMARLQILGSGAGIAGCALASFLLLSSLPADQKPRIAILGRSSQMRAQGQNIDTRGVDLTALHKPGLQTAVRRSTTGEEGAKFVDQNEVICRAFGTDKNSRVQTETSDIEISRGVLANVLYGRCKTISDGVNKDGGWGVDFMFDDYIDGLHQDGAKSQGPICREW